MKKSGLLTLIAMLLLSLTGCSGGEPCDRDCLNDLMDTYLAALVAHDPSAVPLAPNITFVENITRMTPGEGLWETAASGPTRFALHVPDVVQQQAVVRAPQHD